MLAELHAKDFALFKEINVEFSSTFNVITGETGAGKSLFISALKSLCGEKPDFTSNESLLEGRFITEGEKEEIISIKYAPLRSSARLNGSLVSLSRLKKIMESKIAIHSQEAPAILRDSKNHMSFVDLFNSEISLLLTEYKAFYLKYRNSLKHLRKISSFEKMLEERKALENEIEKIEAILVSESDYLDMVSRYKRLANAKEILRNVQEITFLLNEENGVENLLREMLRRAREIERLDEKFEPLFDRIEALLNEATDLERDVENYAINEETDESEMFTLERHISQIESLKRRYGPTLDDVKNTYEEKTSEIVRLDKEIKELKNVEKRVKELKEKLLPLAHQISVLRKNAASELLKIAEENLRDLGMKDARMEFAWEETELGENGADFIEFLGSTNRGLPPLPLSKIASGGETARLYLALEAALGEKLPVETAVFDEVASAVGIRTADVVAEKLKELSEKTQLIVITHMPQIAAVADRHFKVEKYIENGRTFSGIRELTLDERKKEIKEMFGKIPQEVKNE